MKHTFMLVMLALMFIICSCSSQGTMEEADNEYVEKVYVRMDPLEEEVESSSRVVPEKVGTQLSYPWELNDTLGIFPSKGGQVEFVISEKDAGKTTAAFDGGGWALRNSYTYSAYYPFNFYNRNSKAIPFSYIGQVQTGNNNRSHLRNYYVSTAAPTIVENNQLFFNLVHVGSILNLKLIMSEPNTYSSVTVFTEGKVIPIKKTVNLQDNELTQTVIEYSDRVSIGLKNIKTTSANDTIHVWMAFPSMAQSSYPLKVAVYDSEGFPYVANITKLNGDQAYASFTKHKWQERKAHPVLKEGFNINVGGWGNNNEDYGGSAQ